MSGLFVPRFGEHGVPTTQCWSLEAEGVYTINARMVLGPNQSLLGDTQLEFFFLFSLFSQFTSSSDLIP